MIVIDPEFESLIPPLTDDEYKRLEKSILAEGVRDPIITWNGTIVDGHNRYRICMEHGIEFNTKEMQFESRDAAKIWIIENQFGRRNLSKYDRSVLALQLEAMYATEAEKRLHLSQGRGNKGTQNSAEVLGKGETRDKVAAVAGVSHDTIRKVKVIETEAAKGNPTAIKAREAVRKDEKSIHKAYTEVHANGDKSDPRPLCTVCRKPVDDNDHYPHDRNKHKACANVVERDNKRKARQRAQFTEDGRRICSVCHKPIDDGDSYECRPNVHKTCHNIHNAGLRYANPDKSLIENVAVYSIDSLVSELKESVESLRSAVDESIAINRDMGVNVPNGRVRSITRAIDNVVKAIESIKG